MFVTYQNIHEKSWLKSSDNEVKTAVLMEKKKIEKKEAREILKNNDGLHFNDEMILIEKIAQD